MKRIDQRLLGLLSLLLLALFLTQTKESIYFTRSGLTIWYSKMLPALLPFMILSGILIRMGFASSFSPMAYCLIAGFFFGFPMGAKTVTMLYENRSLSKKEAQFLLAFSNNFGLSFLLGFAIPLLELPIPTWCLLLLLYGMPLLYGVVLFLTPTYHQSIFFRHHLTKNSSVSKLSFAESVDESIRGSIASILQLGGYIVFFNLCNLIPYWFFQKITLHTEPVIKLYLLSGCILEVSGGLNRLGNRYPMLSLITLTFGGLSCMAQTYSILKSTDLSFSNYAKHKLIQTAICTMICAFFFSFYA